MPIVFDYRCDNCGKYTTNQEMNSFICECEGTFRLVSGTGVPSTTFEAGWCPTLKQNVYSWADQEKKAKAFRSADHPKGFVLLQDNKKYLRHLKNVLKNKDDVRAEQYAKDGIKYPKGKQVYFKEDEGRFVHKVSKEPLDTKRYSIPTKPLRVSEKVKMKSVAVFLGLMLIASTSFAKIDGVPYVTLKVNRADYQVPIHQPDFTKQDAKIVIDLLNGDKASRQIFLGGQKEKIIFIGDGETVHWLHVNETDQWVT